MDKVRLFFALPVEAGDARAIEHWLGSAPLDIEAGWVPAENYHVTLAFLGATPESMVPDLIDFASEKLDIGLLPIRWPVNHVSRFRAGVVYLGGYQEPAAMHRFHRSLSFLVPLHDRPAQFVPHITLARDAPRLELPPVDLTMTFSRVSLMQSVSTPSGVRYHSLYDWTVVE